MKCIKCSTDFPDDQDVCPNCGTKVLRLENHATYSPFQSVDEAAAKKTTESIVKAREELQAKLKAKSEPKPEPEPEPFNPFTHVPHPELAPQKPEKKGLFSFFKKK